MTLFLSAAVVVAAVVAYTLPSVCSPAAVGNTAFLGQLAMIFLYTFPLLPTLSSRHRAATSIERRLLRLPASQ